MSRGGGEMEERLLNASETEQRRESLYLRKKIWSEVRKMWRIALPSTLFRVMSFGCIVVAQAFIGHSSETGLAAYALIQSTFIRFIYGVMAGMSSATETLCGQAYGAQQYHMMGIYLQRSWIVDTFTATLFVPFIIFAGPILRLLGQNLEITKTVDEIYPWVIPYLYSIVFTMTMQMYLQAQMKNAIIGVLSTVALVVDIVATWWCVSVMGMGIHGALLGLNISSWTVVIAEFVYVFGGWCPHTWTGFSTAAFVDLFPMLKLSISSGFMLCLEYWYMSIIVLMSGYTEDANIAISAFSICQYIYTWEMNISLGLLGAACVRVANELGKGDADAVRFSIKVVLVVSAVIGVLCSVLCLAFGGQISYLFSDSHQVSDAVADLSIVLSLSILLNIVQPILSGVAIGAGMQSVVAFVNLGTYYGVGIPFGFILINIFRFGVKGTVIQGFIPPGRIKKYLPDMKRGSVYKLINFYGSKNKPVYRVADHLATVSFTWNSEMSALHEIPISIDEDRFRFHSHEDFETNCDLKGDLYDVVCHMKLVDGQTLIERPIIDDVKIATTRHIMIHVQSHDGPVMKLYLWDQAATDFIKKFNSCENTPTVLLVTTVNTKRLGGTLALTSMSSTRVFMDNDVQPTRNYLTWLGSNPEIANQVSADVITKRETLTIADIFSYMSQESAKDAFFECTATIDDVVHGSSWYYIGCSECHSKATKGTNSLICTNAKCAKVNTTGVAQYRAKISVYDNTEQAFFVLLGDAGRELTGRHASELVSNYFKANKSEGADHEVPIPEALISIIGQTHKFCVKVTDHNFSGNTRAVTVTKILPLDTPPPTEASVGNDIGATSEEAKQSGNNVCEPPTSRGDPADEDSKRTCGSADPGTAKRPRCGN